MDVSAEWNDALIPRTDTTPKFCNLVQTVVIGGKYAGEWKELSQNAQQWDDSSMDLEE